MIRLITLALFAAFAVSVWSLVAVAMGLPNRLVPICWLAGWVFGFCMMLITTSEGRK